MQIFLVIFYVSVYIFYENMPLVIFNVSIESAQNKKQYSTKVTWTEIRRGVMMFSNVI